MFLADISLKVGHFFFIYLICFVRQYFKWFNIPTSLCCHAFHT